MNKNKFAPKFFIPNFLEKEPYNNEKVQFNKTNQLDKKRENEKNNNYNNNNKSLVSVE